MKISIKFSNVIEINRLFSAFKGKVCLNYLLLNANEYLKTEMRSLHAHARSGTLHEEEKQRESLTLEPTVEPFTPF